MLSRCCCGIIVFQRSDNEDERPKSVLRRPIDFGIVNTKREGEHEVSSSNNDVDLYPDISSVGGLHSAISNRLQPSNSLLSVSPFPEGVQPSAYSYIQHENYSCQVFMALEERLFLSDFWRDGVAFASGQTSSLEDTVMAIERWVFQHCDLDQLQQLSFVELQEKARIYDEGKEVEAQWTMYLDTMDKSSPALFPFVEEAAKHTQLRLLFPYTSMNRFCLSRCTGYPYTTDIPFVEPLLDGSYDVRTHNGDLLGKGDASESVSLVIANLPPNCGPAVRGTSDSCF